MPFVLLLAVAALVTQHAAPADPAGYGALPPVEASAADQGDAGRCATSVQVLSVTPRKATDRPGDDGWRVAIRISGCGRSSAETINVARAGRAEPSSMALGLPGRSLADRRLQEGVFRSVLLTATADAPNCREAALGDVYVTARAGGIDIWPPGVPMIARKGRPAASLPDAIWPSPDRLDLTAAWEEVWPLQVCGRDRTLGVVFIPFKDGKMVWNLLLPIWQMVQARGPGSLSAIAPPAK